MILYSKPIVDQVLFNRHYNTFKEIAAAPYAVSFEKFRLSYQQFENDLNSIPEHVIINRNARLALWIYKIQHGYKSLTTTFENVVYTNHGIEGKVYRYCREYATVFNIDLDHHSIDVDDDIFMLDVPEREAIDIEARHKKDILDLKDIVREELDVYCAEIVNHIKKAVKIFNQNSQPDYNDYKIKHACENAVGVCALIANYNM